MKRTPQKTLKELGVTNSVIQPGTFILDCLPKCALISVMTFTLKKIIGAIGKFKESNSNGDKFLLHNLYVSAFVGMLHSISSGSNPIDGVVEEEIAIYTLRELVAHLHRMKPDDYLSYYIVISPYKICKALFIENLLRH